MITYLILIIILAYSSWILYKTIKDKLRGKCDSCSGCSLNGGCPIQQLRSEKNKQLVKKLHLKV